MEGKVFDERNRIVAKDVLYRCIYAGRGQIDLVAPSGKSHCYRFEIPRDDDFPKGMIFVYAIHENQKFYIGLVEHNKFRLTKHSKFDRDTEVVKGAYYIVNQLTSDHDLSSIKMKLYHNGRCAKCGRVLVDTKQLALGIGKKCLNHFSQNME